MLTSFIIKYKQFWYFYFLRVLYTIYISVTKRIYFSKNMILMTRTKLPNEHNVCSATKIHKNKLLLKLKLFCKLSSRCINFLTPQSKRDKNNIKDGEWNLFTKCSKFIALLIANFTFFNQSCFSKNLNPRFAWSKKEINNKCSTKNLLYRIWNQKKRHKKTKQIK